MNETTNAIIDKIWKALNGISGLGQVSHDQYKSIYLKTFKEARNNDVKLGGDAISDIICARYGEQMKEGHNEALRSLVASWREWNFFLDNYEKV